MMADLPGTSGSSALPQPAPAPSLEALLGELGALERLTSHWPEEQRAAVQAHTRAIDALNAEAFKRLIRQLDTEPAAKAVLRTAVSDEFVYAVLRRHGILKPSLYERVEAALDAVRPALESHGGDVELVAISADVAEVRLLGACDGCPASALTFYSGVKKAIQDHVPEIAEVKQARGIAIGAGTENAFESPFATENTNPGGPPWIDVVALSELPLHAPHVAQVADSALLLTRFDDDVTCFANACAHLGQPLAEGAISDGVLTCPHHGFRYALRTGQCLTTPEIELASYPVRIVNGRVQVQVQS